MVLKSCARAKRQQVTARVCVKGSNNNLTVIAAGPAAGVATEQRGGPHGPHRWGAQQSKILAEVCHLAIALDELLDYAHREFGAGWISSLEALNGPELSQLLTILAERPILEVDR